MEITAEFLGKLRDDINKQRDESLRDVGAAEGAIKLIDFLIERLGGGVEPPPKEEEHGELE